MSKQIQTSKAPMAVGPYSQGIVSGDTIYVSGQLPIDPKTNNMIMGNIEDQTIQILKNINEILMEASFSLEEIVMVHIYMTNLSHFDKVNKEYEKYFHTIKPARVTVGVASLPKNSELEISVIAKRK